MQKYRCPRCESEEVDRLVVERSVVRQMLTPAGDVAQERVIDAEIVEYLEMDCPGCGYSSCNHSEWEV